MKTKIIYISGNEVFEMSEIRAAFDEVRGALGLDKDTILFGVPVDSDNALADNADNVACKEAADTPPVITEEPCSVLIHEEAPKQTEIPVISEETSAIIEEEHAEITEVLETCAEEPINTEMPDDVSESAEDKIIPILSVLGGPQAETTPQIEDVATAQVTVTDNTALDNTPGEIIADVNIDARLIAPTMTEEAQSAEIEHVTIGDMIDEEAPVPNMEKTLEQLLESMTPLREDITNNHIDDSTAEDTAVAFEENDTDATLAQLASEFAENEDKIPNTPKADHQGKIGKLKNILPFKKAKRDDGGLMGDLFGWAGIAANDEDFSIPGFFANAKKQGA